MFDICIVYTNMKQNRFLEKVSKDNKYVTTIHHNHTFLTNFRYFLII